METKYYYIRTNRKGEKPRRIYVREIRPGVGQRVTVNGDLWSRIHGAFEQIEVVLFTKKDIIRRMRMNNHYGQLETWLKREQKPLSELLDNLSQRKSS